MYHPHPSTLVILAMAPGMALRRLLELPLAADPILEKISLITWASPGFRMLRLEDPWGSEPSTPVSTFKTCQEQGGYQMEEIVDTPRMCVVWTIKAPLTASPICWMAAEELCSCIHPRTALTPPSVAKRTRQSYFNMTRYVNCRHITTNSLSFDCDVRSSTRSFTILSLKYHNIY